MPGRCPAVLLAHKACVNSSSAKVDETSPPRVGGSSTCRAPASPQALSSLPVTCAQPFRVQTEGSSGLTSPASFLLPALQGPRASAP